MSSGGTAVRTGLALATGAILAFAGCEEVSVNVLSTASVEISPDSVTIFEGGEQEVSAIPRSSAGDILTGRRHEWTTDDPDIAVVSQEGVVRGEAVGSTTLRVRTDGVEASAPVVVLPRPEISLSRSSVEFDAVQGEEDPPDEELDVVNTGGGELTGLSLTVETSGDGAGWLLASLGSTVAPTTLTLSASVGSREPGDYEGTVLVSAPEANNSPQEVRVTLRVAEPPPIIEVDPSSVRFSSISRSRQVATQTVTVRNIGGSTLSGLFTSVEYIAGSGWLTAQLTSTTADPETILELEASARFLDPGVYEATVEVSSDLIAVESQTVRVVFEVSSGGSTSQ